MAATLPSRVASSRAEARAARLRHRRSGRSSPFNRWLCDELTSVRVGYSSVQYRYSVTSYQHGCEDVPRSSWPMC